MSLINDALKKAAKEKASPEAPSFGSKGFDITPPPKKGPGRERGILFGLLGILALVIVVFVFTAKKPKSEPVSAPKKESPSPLPLPIFLPTLPTPAEHPLVLNGIAHGEGEEMAVINNQIMRVGEDIEGTILLEVGENFVILQRGEKEFKLKLK